MKVISCNSRILNRQEQTPSTFDRELLGMLYKSMNFSLFELHILYNFLQITNLFKWFHKKGNLSPRLYGAQIQLTKCSQLKVILTPGKKHFSC